jgi:signal transduction histidine kinase
MILALAPPMAVLSLGTTRLMQATLQKQASATLDYVTAQNTVAINHDLSNLRALVEQDSERIQQTVSAALAEGAVGDLIAQGRYADAGAGLVSALGPSGASMITILDATGTTVARATDRGRYGDRVLWEQHQHASRYVTNLRPRVRAAEFTARPAAGMVVLSASVLKAEKVTPGAAIAGLTKPGDRLSDQAWILLQSGLEHEERGLALASFLPVPDRRGVVRGVAIAAKLMNRETELAQTYRRVTGRWMAMCLGSVIIGGNLPTDRKHIIGEILPRGFAAPVLRQGKRRFTQRLTSTGVELNAAAAPLRDVSGVVVGMLVAGSPLTELQRVVDRMQAEAARLEARSLLALLVWLCVGVAVALVLAALASRGILRSIRQLQVGARRIGEGDFSYRLQVRSGDELEQLAAEFNQMAEHLEGVRDQERLAIIGRTASTIVHDIQNTLTSIRGYAPLLAEENLPPDQRREFAAILVESVQRIADMARDLLEYARGEQAELELRSMSVDEYLRQIRPQLERELRDSNIRLALDLDCPAPARIDPARLSRVIFNLAANARDAMGGSGVFTISSRCERGYAEIRCSDTGPGVPPEMEGRLFQPFASYGKPYGTGLGLAICKQIVEAHGGVIEVARPQAATAVAGRELAAHSEPGKGATFIVRLPLADANSGAPNSP